MKDSFWPGVFIVVIVFLFIGSIFYYVHSKSECNAKDGVLVRTATGLYACVDRAAVK